LNGCDAVVSSLGTGLSPFREVSLLTVATGALVTAITRNGVRRLVCISAPGATHGCHYHVGIWPPRGQQPATSRRPITDSISRR